MRAYGVYDSHCHTSSRLCSYVWTALESQTCSQMLVRRSVLQSFLPVPGRMWYKYTGVQFHKRSACQTDPTQTRSFSAISFLCSSRCSHAAVLYHTTCTILERISSKHKKHFRISSAELHTHIIRKSHNAPKQKTVMSQTMKHTHTHTHTHQRLVIVVFCTLVGCIAAPSSCQGIAAANYGGGGEQLMTHQSFAASGECI